MYTCMHARLNALYIVLQKLMQRKNCYHPWTILHLTIYMLLLLWGLDQWEFVQLQEVFHVCLHCQPAKVNSIPLPTNRRIIKIRKTVNRRERSPQKEEYRKYSYPNNSGILAWFIINYNSDKTRQNKWTRIRRGRSKF